MVPNSWMLKILELFGAEKNVIELLQKNMKHWRTVLFSDKNRLRLVNIESGIIQRVSITLAIRGCVDSCFTGAQKKECTIFIWKRKIYVNHLLFMDDIKLQSNDNEIDNLVRMVKILSENIGEQIEFDVSLM